jgi:DNA-binding response OmpR family regulator
MEALKNILMVEDDANLSKVMSKRLIDQGYNVFLAADIIEASKFVREEKIDLILLDLFLPAGGGISFIEQMMSLAIDIPIIVCTGTKDEDYKNKVLDANIQGFMLKPYDSAKLIVMIKKLIG